MFMNGVASVVAGGTAECEATWMLPLPRDAFAGAAVTWEVLDKEGNAWSSGDAHDLRVQQAPIGTDTHVTASATISVPVDVPSAAEGSTYQVRWSLKYGNGIPQFAFDHFTVYPPVLDNQGPADAVSLWGERVTVSLVMPEDRDDVECQVYWQNNPVLKTPAKRQTVPSGYVYEAEFDTEQFAPLGASLQPFSLLWRHGSGRTAQIERASLWLVNPMILDAQDEVKKFLLKAYSDTGIQPDGDFNPAALMMYLRQGAELFNALGYPTSFTMIRATDSIRALWLRCSIVQACRSQYLSEGLKAFNFSGQVVNLDVDRTQYWESVASSIQQELDQAIKPFKENLARRGILGGDGNINPNALRFGAVGAIGIALTPVSPLRGTASIIGNGRRR